MKNAKLKNEKFLNRVARILSAFVVVLGFQSTAQSSPAVFGKIVEVPVSNVFAPARGFDDNDFVQIVIDGKLPNSCYLQDETKVNLDRASKTIVVKQLALRRQDGDCATSD
jgi:hypothetical protein